MKLTITPSLFFKTPSVRARAVISKSTKLGIPRRFQKTWNLRTVAPQFGSEQLKTTIEAEAKRWEEKVMARIARGEFTRDNTSVDNPPACELDLPAPAGEPNGESPEHCDALPLPGESPTALPDQSSESSQGISPGPS